MIIEYLKSHLKSLILFILFSIIFALVFYLYYLPLEPVIYSVILCISFGMILSSFDFYKFYKRHKKLNEMVKDIRLNLKLPKAYDIIEKDYQNLIKELYKDKANVELMADKKFKDMIEYFTLWAHQIKTPIAAMNLLFQGDKRENSESLIELFKIEQYVEMVLQYLRLDNDSTDYIPGKYNLDHIVRQSLRKYSKIFIIKKIKLNYNDLNTTILSDEKWLSYVLEQLISNALKYTNEGEINIYMEGKTLIIEDTGIGIQAEDLPRVFERGFTGYNGRMDKKSTGIGLYLCKEIIKKLGHNIEIQSQVGIGTKVKINLEYNDFVFE